MSYEIKTRKGYDFYEVSSAFQKSVRRGYEKHALFFGFELYASGYSKYIWKRMLIIASEDIGLADDSVSVKLNALYNNWNIIAEGGGANGASIPFIHAIMILSRAKKSRLTDEAKIYAMKTNDNFEIPDYALDVHTKRGKMKGRGLKYFLEEASRLENVVEIEDDGYADFFKRFCLDKDAKKINDNGYDHRNTVHKNPKEMTKWQGENSQTSMWDTED